MLTSGPRTGYSDFGDIFPSIQALDADVISIEASKADLKLIDTYV